MKNILVLSANPRKDSLGHAMAKTYAEAAASTGNSVEFVHIPSLFFDVNNTSTDIADKIIKEQQKLIEWSEHIVLVSPIWMFSLPGLTKIYFEKTLSAGFAFRYPHPWPLVTAFLPRRLLKGRSVRFITTQDSFRFVSWFIGNPFLVAIPISVFFFVGMFPIRRTVFARVRFSSPSRREQWLRKVEELGLKSR